MSAGKKKPSGGIPLVALFRTEDQRERARRALRHPHTLQPGLKEELDRYADPLKAVAEDMQQLLDDRAQFRQGRPESAATAHIRKLVADHPELAHKPAALYTHRDKHVITRMAKGTWRNKVAAVRPK